jgi:hypothetical protein
MSPFLSNGVLWDCTLLEQILMCWCFGLAVRCSYSIWWMRTAWRSSIGSLCYTFVVQYVFSYCTRIAQITFSSLYCDRSIYVYNNIFSYWLNLSIMIYLCCVECFEVAFSLSTTFEALYQSKFGNSVTFCGKYISIPVLASVLRWVNTACTPLLQRVYLCLV